MPQRVVAIVVAIAIVVFGAPSAIAGPVGYDESWYLNAMHVDDAHEMSKGDGAVVAVIDTGVDPDHPDLKGRVLNGATVTNDGIDDGGGSDPDGHGSAMAGLIAGDDADNDPLIGVAPEAKVLPVRVTRGSDGTLDQKLVYKGVRWAIDHGARVINLSLAGKPTGDGAWKAKLLDYAIAHDAVLIAAVGNTHEGHEQLGEPAAIPGVVAVSGLGSDGDLWSGSITGDAVVLCAPAEDVPHIRPGGEVQPASGTSAATALVSGVAALIVSRFPSASAGDVINRMISTAHDKGAPGRDAHFGYGTVDAYAALTAAVAPNEDYYPLDLPLKNGSAPPQTTKPISWRLITPLVFLLIAAGGVGVWVIRRNRAPQTLPAGTDAAQPKG